MQDSGILQSSLDGWRIDTPETDMVSEVKKRTRAALLKVLQQVPEEQRQLKSQKACELLCATPEFQKARVVMLFLSLSAELDTGHVVREGLSRDKILAVPHIDWEARRLTPVRLQNPDEEMTYNSLGLRWPAKGGEVPVEEIELLIMPGLGFDRQGNRIGRGGGFYDRFLEHEDFRGLTCGLGFQEQLRESIPMTDHDKTLDMLVTDNGVRRFNGQMEPFDRPNII